MRRARVGILVSLLLVSVLVVGGLTARRLIGALGQSATPADGRAGPAAAPVEVGPVEVGTIVHRRVFSGSLEATARATLAAKVGGRIVALDVDLADRVERGQVVARLDSDELAQAVAQAEAELAVARAALAEAESARVIAARELERVETLHGRGVASDSQLDTVRADQLSKGAAVEVARAQLTRAEAALEGARIRLGYATVRAEWSGGGDERVVAMRYAEEGDTISANTPLVSIIALDPIEAVIFATEREYGLLSAGQEVSIRTDAYPGREWVGRVSRVSPVFGEGSRQARVEVLADNPEGMLKPGMFVRVEAVLGRAEDATIVPSAALAERGGRDVVFVVAEDGASVRMAPVEVGIREGDRVEVRGDGVRGRVVTLGHQLIEDGSAIVLPEAGGEMVAGGNG